MLWEGEVQGDGTGPQHSYYVRLYADSTGHCQCPALYFRAVLKRNPAFACKHVIRARAAAAARTGWPQDAETPDYSGSTLPANSPTTH